MANLRALATFPIGVAVAAGTENKNIISTVAARDGVKQHVSQVTAGNIIKMSYLHPSADTFTFEDADELVKFAADSGLKVHGHALIWHSDYQVPAFMKGFAGDRAAWLAMLKTHVQTIGAHFAGKLSSWDVVKKSVGGASPPEWRALRRP